MALGFKTGGRQKGTPNRTTAAVKAALTEAFEKLGAVEGLVQWARREPGEFFKLWAKMLPTEVDLNAQVSLGEILDEVAGLLQQEKNGDDGSGTRPDPPPLES